MEDYKLYSKNKDIPLYKTAGLFYWDKFFDYGHKNIQDILYLFKNMDDKSLQKRIFKQFVGIFNLETSGFCNRVCSYCPVSIYRRNDKTKVIDSYIFNKIIKNLEYLEFNSSICLNYYNEPLLDPHIIERVKEIKIATNGFIHFNSNGDYLNIDILESLIDAGLNKINITLHTLPNEFYSDEQSLEKIKKFYNKLNLAMPQYTINSQSSITTEIKINSFILCVNTVNWSKIGNDRGGTIKQLSISNRTNPCVRVFREIFFDFLGYSYLCCNIFPDKNNALGSITNQTIEEIYAKNYLWRKILFSYSDKPKPCSTCNDDSMCSKDDQMQREQILKMIIKDIH